MDMGASVIARLKNKAKETGKPFQLHLQLFCQEEFLRRLAASCYAENLVLKGGLFIYTLTNFESRATVDIDFLLQQFPGRIEDIKRMVDEIISVDSGNDFITFTSRGSRRIYLGNEFDATGISLDKKLFCVDRNSCGPDKIRVIDGTSEKRVFCIQDDQKANLALV